MQDMEPVLRNGLMETGLHETNCVEPKHGFVDYLVENNFISIKELVYAASASSASINSKNPIDGEFVKKFVAAGIALDNFKWADDVQDLHKDRLYGRVAMLFDETVRHNVKSKERVESGESDDPIQPATSENCAQEFEVTYGEVMDADKLPSDAILGKVHRGILSRNFPEIRVTSVCSQDSYDQQGLNDVGFDNGN